MIELNNISLDNIRILDYDILMLLKQERAKTLGDLVRIMDKYPNNDWGTIIYEIKNIEKYLKLANKRDEEPEVYYTLGYKDDSLKLQDSLNCGNILLLDNPTDKLVRFKCLNDMTIEKIKRDLSLTSTCGSNYLSFNNSKIGSKSLPKIQNAIQMFENQIIRQSLLTKERDINLFEFDYDQKKEIVNDKYAEIITYLIYNTDNKLVWGNLSDNQKRLYMSSIINKKSIDIETRNKIISYISSYTTVPELLRMERHDYKTLKRFIVK